MKAGNDTIFNKADARSAAFYHLCTRSNQEVFNLGPFQSAGNRVREYCLECFLLPAVHDCIMRYLAGGCNRKVIAWAFRMADAGALVIRGGRPLPLSRTWRKGRKDAVVPEPALTMQADYSCQLWFVETVQFQELLRIELMKRAAQRGLLRRSTILMRFG